MSDVMTEFQTAQDAVFRDLESAECPDLWPHRCRAAGGRASDVWRQHGALGGAGHLCGWRPSPTFFDGYLARKWQQQSSLGRDAGSDRRQGSGGSCAAGAVCRRHPVWRAYLGGHHHPGARGSGVGLREYLGALQVSVPVTQIAKWKTTVQLLAIGFLIAGPAGDSVFPYITQIGIVGLWIAAALTLYTGYDYFRAGIRHVVDEE